MRLPGLLLLASCALLPAQEPQASAAAKPRRDGFARTFFGLSAASDPAAVERGQQLNVTNCGFCHGTNANGGNSGPDLVRSVLVLHDEGLGTQIGQVILNGRPAKGMPKFNVTDAQVKDIAAFLLGRSQAAVKIRWTHPFHSESLGFLDLLSTAGKLLFSGGPSGNLIAFEPVSGRILWHAGLAASGNNAPMTFELDGRQYRVAGAGHMLYAFTLPDD